MRSPRDRAIQLSLVSSVVCSGVSGEWENGTGRPCFWVVRLPVPTASTPVLSTPDLCPYSRRPVPTPPRAQCRLLYLVFAGRCRRGSSPRPPGRPSSRELGTTRGAPKDVVTPTQLWGPVLPVSSPLPYSHTHGRRLGPEESGLPRTSELQYGPTVVVPGRNARDGCVEAPGSTGGRGRGGRGVGPRLGVLVVGRRRRVGPRDHRSNLSGPTEPPKGRRDPSRPCPETGVDRGGGKVGAPRLTPE